jgi:hypothetical protein
MQSDAAAITSQTGGVAMRRFGVASGFFRA